MPTRQHYEDIAHILSGKYGVLLLEDQNSDARRMGNKQDELEMCVCKVSGCAGVNFPHSSPYSVVLGTCS